MEEESAAVDLFLRELSDAFELIEGAPQIGRVYRGSPVRQVRRLLLKETRYRVYYVVMANEVSVLAVWHAQRGVGPPLRVA